MILSENQGKTPKIKNEESTMSFTYKGLQAAKKRHIVTPEEVEQQLEHLVATRPRITQVTDRKTKNGDEVLLDYAGFCEDKQFEGGTAEGQTLVLGSGTFIPGFEEQLVDKAIGEQVSVKVVFPEQYHAKDLAGKDAEFRCVIHEIHEKGKYQMDEVFAREVGQCETMEQMRDRMGRSMQYYSDEQAEMELQDSLLQQAAQTLELEITDKQVDEAIEEQLQSMKAQLAQQGLSLEMYCQFMQTTEEKLRQEAVPAARQSIRTAATIEKIVALEDLKAEEDEIFKACEHICKRNNITMDVLKSMEDDNLDEMVERAVLTSKVMSLIRENAQITEE